MASVHLGRAVGSAGFARTVAIKRLHPHLAGEPDFLSTLVDEARLAARIHHPNVVPTLDVVATEDELLLVMEYIRGESLARLFRTEFPAGHRIPLPFASAIAVGALHGLHAAHEATGDRGVPLAIVHRDVSPQNILVGIDGVARVIDFGVAKAAGRLQTTRDGVLKGKVAYMSPEQLRAGEVTRRVDVYAMAVVLWEMLAARHLFTADSEGSLIGVVLGGAKQPPSRYAPDVPPALDALVMRGLAIDPSERFPTAFEMAEELARIARPALPPAVGAWVSRVAEQTLAKQGALLADIEADSNVVTVAKASPGASRASGARPVAPGPADDEVPTIASQPSSLSVETRRRSNPPGTPSVRAWMAGSIGLGVIVIGALAALLLVKARTHAAGDGLAEPASSAPIPEAPVVALPPSAEPSDEAAASVTPGPAASVPTPVASARPFPVAPKASSRPNPAPPAAPPRPAPQNGIPAEWN